MTITDEEIALFKRHLDEECGHLNCPRVENQARQAIARIRADAERIKALDEESTRRLSLVEQYERELPKAKAENASLRAEVERLKEQNETFAKVLVQEGLMP